MKKEFIVDRQGKNFVLYAGLLDTAHEQGLKSITTTLLQVPSPENGQVAICQAIVQTDRGTFSGIGDASPENLSRAMVPHSIRMAECVPLRAQILTRDGWKHYDELRIGEEVLAYDVAMDVCRWTALVGVSVYREPYDTVRLASRSFDITCTPHHTWPVKKVGTRVRTPQRELRKTSELRTSDRIIVAAPAEEGHCPLTPREAALLGWLATDGTVREQMVAYRGRQYGPYRRAFIAQSKPQYLDELRSLVGPNGSEQVSSPRERDFGAYVSTCLPAHKFELTAQFARDLFDKAGIEHFADLPRLCAHLSREARSAMLDAMLKGDGTVRRGDSWTFGQKSKPGVTEAFTILATLCGFALGKPRVSSVGDVPVWQVRKNRLVSAWYLSPAPAEPQPVWCPTTQYGTWVMNLDGQITITGNTRAKARALRDAVNVGVTALEELGELDEELEANAQTELPFGERRGSPTPLRRPAPARPPEPLPGENPNGATPAQVRAIYLIGRSQHGLSEAEVDERCQAQFGRAPDQLSKRQASELIDALKNGAGRAG